MRDQVPKRIEYNGMTVEGFSRAAVQTYWRIPEFKLGFDLGAQPWDFMGTPRWFVSHTHMDHLLALPAYLARRRMMKMSPPQIYLPKESVGAVNQLINSFTKLDRGQLPCELIGVSPGEELVLSREIIVSVHKTFHTIPSLGFVVWDRRKKLKEEYLSLSGPEIRDLSQSGVEISYEVRVPKLAYLGDSTARGLDENPAMYDAEILIMEVTFVTPEHRKEAIAKFGHVHLDDLIARRNKFKNSKIIAAHFSTRYNDWQITEEIRKRVPDMLDDRLIIWI